MIARQMVAFYIISSSLLAGKSAFCYVINAVCYVSCYLPALKIQQRCDKSSSYFLLLSTTEKISFYIGRVFKHGLLFIFMFYSHGRLFKRALNQDRAGKQVYTVRSEKRYVAALSHTVKSTSSRQIISCICSEVQHNNKQIGFLQHSMISLSTCNFKKQKTLVYHISEWLKICTTGAID